MDVFYFPQITKVVVGLAIAEFLALITAIVFTILHLIYRKIVAIFLLNVFLQESWRLSEINVLARLPIGKKANWDYLLGSPF